MLGCASMIVLPLPLIILLQTILTSPCSPFYIQCYFSARGMTHFHHCLGNPLKEYCFSLCRRANSFGTIIEIVISLYHISFFLHRGKRKGEPKKKRQGRVFSPFPKETFSSTLSINRFAGLCKERKVMPTESAASTHCCLPPYRLCS